MLHQTSSVAHILGCCLPWKKLIDSKVSLWARVATSINGGLDQMCPEVSFPSRILGSQPLSVLWLAFGRRSDHAPG